MRELRAAIELEKPIIVVTETDMRHGGVPLATHARQAPEGFRPLLDGTHAGDGGFERAAERADVHEVVPLFV